MLFHTATLYSILCAVCESFNDPVIGEMDLVLGNIVNILMLTLYFTVKFILVTPLRIPLGLLVILILHAV